MAGVPESITTRARELLTEFETKHITLSLTRTQNSVIQELEKVTIADLTPTQALAQIEKWQNLLTGKGQE
jgi:DNA mismatch repair ATPase MutS